MSKVSVSRYHDGTVRIAGQDVAIGVKRLVINEFIPFEQEYFFWAGGGEQELPQPVDGEDAMQVEDLLAARAKAHKEKLARRTPAEKKAADDRMIQQGRELAAWIERRVVENVVVKPGELDIDGEPVETGAKFFEVFGVDTALMMQALNLLWALNKLPESAKKKLKSLSDSEPGSQPQGTEAPGPTPEPIAESAGAEDSAPPGGATPEQS